ncbi:MAG: SDR family oxidoreductase [Gammaproteobacteria bacterium]|nr:SDR family oxidoreductase [Gammaproteobacteria bacterium]TVQ48595.1 MAG: SDR family oxidoreductase [Gammaproteobacteria bacterium]
MIRLDSLGSEVNVLVQGASRGLGREFVRQLLHCPDVGRVWAGCRQPEALALPADTPTGGLRPLRLDITDEGGVAAAAEDVARETDTLSLIINVAGILHTPEGMCPERRLAEVEPANMVLSYQVNALGPLLVAKHFAALLPRRERAVFASLSARVGSIGDNHLGGWYAYRAAKAAQNMLTRNLSVELPRRHRGVLCIALHPGTVDTDLSAPFQGNVPAERLFSRERAVTQLLEIINGLGADDQGRFIAWDGQTIPW